MLLYYYLLTIHTEQFLRRDPDFRLNTDMYYRCYIRGHNGRSGNVNFPAGLNHTETQWPEDSIDLLELHMYMLLYYLNF